jgi:DNA-3-methyladenine glycosylase II
MRRHTTELEVAGPWSLAIGKAFWEGFAPAALPGSGDNAELRTVFVVDDDWSRAEAAVRQDGATAHITVTGDGNLDAAAVQTARFLSLDVDGRGWPAVGDRDPVIGAAQRELPGLRPCGFHSPYEAAVWAVLSQRIRITQAARLRDDLVRRHGSFPHPACSGRWSSTCPAGRPNICAPSPRPPSTGCSTAPRCASWIPRPPSSGCAGSRGWDRSPPSS